MLEHKILIKLFVLNCVNEECSSAVCVVSSLWNTKIINKYLQHTHNYDFSGRLYDIHSHWTPLTTAI